MTLAPPVSVGIVGGTGMLGSSIARAWLGGGVVPPNRLWICNRSGRTAGLEDWPGVSFTADAKTLAASCDVVLLALPPATFPTVAIDAPDALVISVMAGVGIEEIRRMTRARRIVRAMSNPAAEQRLAYSPWHSPDGLGAADREIVQALLGACGLTDEVPSQDQIDLFTALTGPVPGFVAFYADCMVAFATSHGVAPDVAERAIRQLFLASGTLMANSPASPGEHVQGMIDYAGTTAAGLEEMRRSPLAASIDRGLEAAYRRARTMGSEPGQEVAPG